MVIITMQCNNIGGKVHDNENNMHILVQHATKVEKMDKIIIIFLSQQLFS
jgi:hypothetical protein